MRVRIRPPVPNSPEAIQGKQIGIGELLISGKVAGSAVMTLERAMRVLEQDPDYDIDRLLELMKLQAKMNRQLLDCGKASLKPE